ncbi:MAG: DUF814 domain-containing protein [Ignavibacteria bacterium]|nr:DUF814 domain-containing protein [Ignavibacteria bacterium]
MFVLKKKDDESFLEINVTPGQSFINLRTKYSRAKKNTINFFNEANGQSVKSISIADDDRIVKLELSNAEIYFTIRGKHTNVFSFREDKVQSFKTEDGNITLDISNEFKQKHFVKHFNIPELVIQAEKDYLSAVKLKYPFIGNDILKEVKARAKSKLKTELQSLLKNVLLEIEKTKPTLFINEDSSIIGLAFKEFKSIPFTKKKLYDDLITAQNYFFSKKHYLENKQKKFKIITKHLNRELKKIASKINNLQGTIERGTKEEEYNKIGSLLLININKLKSGMKEIVIEDIYGSNEHIKIKVNPNFSPKKNIDYYFDKSKADKISFQKSKEMLKKAEVDFNNLKRIEEKLTKIDSLKELDEIMKELKIKKYDQKKEKEDLKDKFKQYLVDEKYNVYVGKDSKNNDLLTTKFAKQNDLWFHARSVSGSHVVLRVENTKEVVPKNILKKTASLAAYHSKAKTAGTVPVAYTFKKYVVKKKGDPVGTVHLLREDVLLVKPEIPKDCEYVDKD